MEIIDDCEAVLSNAEVLEVLRSIKQEATKSGFKRPEVHRHEELCAHILPSSLQVAVLSTDAYLESSNCCNVTPSEVQQLYAELAKFPPLEGQMPLKKKELLNIANFRPTTLVSLRFAVFSAGRADMFRGQAEARFGDDRLEEMIALVEKTLSAPPEVESEEMEQAEEDEEV
eukprot:768441-Hanusia_phi.AAC.4